MSHKYTRPLLMGVLALSISGVAQSQTSQNEAQIMTVQADDTQAKADIRAALAKIDRGLQSRPVPRPIYPPFEDGQIEKWIEDAALARKTILASQDYLPKFAKVDLGSNPGTVSQGAPYDNSDVQRMQRYATSQRAKSDKSYADMSKAMSDGLNGYQNEMQYYKGPTAEENFARLRAYGKAALAIEEGLGRDAAKPKAFLKSLAGYESKLADANAATLENFKLPKAQSKDRKRLKAAKAILETKKYGFGDYGPIVLTTKEIVERERKDKEIEVEDVDVSLSGDVTWSGTETVWTYKWDEFKFVVPIKEDDSDDWYMWTITAKKFSSGGERTPIGKWVSGKSYKGSQILKKNF